MRPIEVRTSPEGMRGAAWPWRRRRAGNVIGGGDWSEDRLVPDLIRGFQAHEPVRIRYPKAIRPWQHVLDPLRGYILLAEHLLDGKMEASSAFNFGPSEEDAWSVERIAGQVAALWGEDASWISDAAPALHEAHTLKLDASKARSQLGWRSKLQTGTALEWTIGWYQAWRRGGDMGQETRNQIGAYDQLPN